MTPAVDALDGLGISYELRSYEPPTDAEGYGLHAAAALGLDPADVFKTLMVDLGSLLGVCVVPVTHNLSLKAAATALGSKKASMATVAQAQRSSGYTVGGISPLGQRRPRHTVVDDTATQRDFVWVSGGKRGLEIGLRPADLIRATGATTAAIRA